MTDLQTFIEQALTAVAQGVKRAADSSPDFAVIAPVITRRTETINKRVETEEKGRVEMIEFDIAVTVTEETSKGSKASAGAEARSEGLIKIVAADAGVTGEISAERNIAKTDSRVSRIRFRVPVLFRGKPSEFHTQIDDASYPDPKRSAEEWNRQVLASQDIHNNTVE